MSSHPQLGQRRSGFPRGSSVEIDFEGKAIRAHSGETVAVALLAAGVRVLARSIKFHRPRSAFCLSGDCGSCLMRIDGQPNQRACRTPVQDGLRCERQNAWPSASLDILEAADEMFPDGMDHHTLMTSPRPLNLVMQKVVQRLGGLGRLPDDAPTAAELPLGHSRHVTVVVIGAGPAGLQAATAAAQAMIDRSPDGTPSVLLLDAAPEAGGSYLSDPRFGPAAAAQALTEARSVGVEILTSAAAIGYYGEETAPAAPGGRRGMLAVLTPDGILKVSAECFIYATGGHEQNQLFADNDRPGVMAGRAVGKLHTHYGLSVGRRPLIVGDGDYAAALEKALRDAGAEVIRVAGTGERLGRALGRTWVDGAILVSPDGAERRIDCDIIAVVEPPAPAFELPRMHGAALSFVPERGFVVLSDEDGQTNVSGVRVCGEVAGALGVAAAEAAGRRVGAAAVAGLR